MAIHSSIRIVLFLPIFVLRPLALIGAPFGEKDKEIEATWEMYLDGDWKGLCNAIDDETAGMPSRQLALVWLGRLGSVNREISQTVLQTAQDPDIALRTFAIRTAGELGLREARDTLVASLSEQLSSASAALATMGETSATSPLYRIYRESEDWPSRAHIAAALWRLGERDAELWETLSSRKDSPNSGDRQWSAVVFGLSGDRRAMSVLQEYATRDKDLGTRMQALQELVRNWPLDSFEALTACMADEQMRTVAVDQLGVFLEKAIVPQLEKGLTDRNESVRMKSEQVCDVIRRGPHFRRLHRDSNVDVSQSELSAE